MNSQGKLFDEYYDYLLGYLVEFSERALNGSVPVEVSRQIINSLMSAYTDSYVEEVDYILQSLDLALNDTERNNINNRVGTSQFARNNYNRLAEILSRRAEDINELGKDPELDEETAKQKALNIVLTIAVSELQMAVERASVNASSVIEDVLETKLVKTWNSVNDAKTCEICRALDGTTIPVKASFASTAQGSTYAEELDYGGSDVAYAHPRCRCWLTYSKA